MSHDEAIQELLVLRQQVAELRCAQPPTGIYQSQIGKPGHRAVSLLPTSDLSEAFEMSENLVSLAHFLLKVFLGTLGEAGGGYCPLYPPWLCLCQITMSQLPNFILLAEFTQEPYQKVAWLHHVFLRMIQPWLTMVKQYGQAWLTMVNHGLPYG